MAEQPSDGRQATERRRGFDHRAIDAKWQAKWAADDAFSTPSDPRPGKKHYILDMFPYPSGAGLHVGHPRGYVATDVIARLRRAQGYDVLHPMGWDAFGLPAENYAIKTGIHPAQTTQASIARFKEQIQSIGLSYDWSRELDTSSPSYYRWTQWLFVKLFEAGLAYQKEAPVNWCPNDQTVLANEQVVDGTCDRCGATVLQRSLKQWFLRTTAYADELLTSLEQLEWPEPIKTMQRNWIGKSQGALIHFPIDSSDMTVDVFSTRIDTLYSAAFLILAPEHPLVERLTTDQQRSEVERYVEATTHKTALQRTAEKEQTGVFTGSYAINPINQQRLPVWMSDFVIGSYGAGAAFADAHDERDFAMAKRYDIPMTVSVLPESTAHDAAILALDECFTEDGILINSGPHTGLSSAEARVALVNDLARQGAAEPSTHYRLRDWLVSRQRYWGAPIPIVHCQKCGAIAVPETQLPVTLPSDVDFLPTGESPLARSASFRYTECPSCGGPAERDTDTMDTFVDSSWYFLRFLNPHDGSQAIDRQSVRSWLPVDVYVGGAEHAILHLLYARFMTKALDDLLNLGVREPFTHLVNVGLVRADDGRKMSKSLGNVVNPDEVIAEYGADTLRAYELFMGPFSDSMPWSTRSMVGVRRWLDRIWGLTERISAETTAADGLERALNKTIAKLGRDIPEFKFNTAVSALMELTNVLAKAETIAPAVFQPFLVVLAPIAPHLAAELWERLGFPGELAGQSWPAVDEQLLVADQLTIAIQINGKTRATITVPADATEATVVQSARSEPAIQRHLTGEPRRTIVVPGRIINFIS